MQRISPQFSRLGQRTRYILTLARRLARFALVSLRFAGLVWLIDPLRRRFGTAAIPEKPVRLREYFECLGGGSIKLGQMLALQPDIIPEAYCNELFDLMDRVRPYDIGTARRILEEELGQPVEATFDLFDPEPLATASIGQVYAAVLGGQRVAVKIQRPEANAQMLPDIYLAALFVNTIRSLHLAQLYWLIEPISEFVRWSHEELDYRNEARYTSQAYENARGEAFEKVPKVFWEFTTRRVAVFEFLQGVTVLDFMRARAQPEQVPLFFRPAEFRSHDYCTHIIDNFLDGAFNCGLYHADLHPANLLILDHNAVGYVDYGITGVLGEYSRQNLIALTLAYAQGNAGKMFEIFLRISTVSAESDFEGLERGLRALAHRVSAEVEAGSQISITSVMLEWLRLSRQTNIWPQRDVIKYIRSAVAVDGLIKRLDPEFEVGPALARAARRHVEAGLRRQVFSSEQMFHSFSELVELLARGATPLRNALDELACEDFAK
jgi:ubiquinone biosynthesis protein